MTKYVVINERLGEDRDGNFIDRECLYVFSGDIIHREFAHNLSTRSRIKAGGFVGIQSDGKHYCYGKSESLNLPSRPEDTDLLRILLGENL